MMFLPQSHEPQRIAPSLLLPGNGSGYLIAGSSALPTGAGQGCVTDIFAAAAVSFGQTSSTGLPGCLPMVEAPVSPLLGCMNKMLGDRKFRSLVSARDRLAVFLGSASSPMEGLVEGDA